MKVARQALAVARIEVGEGTPVEKARVRAWDRLRGLLSTLDSKTSALLRFNAIVVAALAYLVIVRASDPFAGVWCGHQDSGLHHRPCQLVGQRR